MRILAIDYGTVRMGLAISDDLGMIAQPLDFIPAEPLDEFITKLKTILTEKQVGEILVGMPRNMDGTYGPSAERVRAFIATLKETIATPIRTWDERLTSAQANRLLIQADMRRDKRKQRVDGAAAAILLQSFLDSREV
jgi:putative holliday junction resolvase